MLLAEHAQCKKLATLFLCIDGCKLHWALDQIKPPTVRRLFASIVTGSVGQSLDIRQKESTFGPIWNSSDQLCSVYGLEKSRAWQAGTKLASASADGILRLWEPRRGGGEPGEIAASQSVCVFVFPYAQRKGVTTDITMHVCIPGLRRNRHAHAFMHDLVHASTSSTDVCTPRCMQCLRPGAGMNELQALILKPLYVDGGLRRLYSALETGNKASLKRDAAWQDPTSGTCGDLPPDSSRGISSSRRRRG